jgi:chromosome segregation and condensation protein ScpB
VTSLAERGLIEESGRSQFGAAIFKTSELFERLFGLSGSTSCRIRRARPESPRMRGSCASAC